MGESVSSKECQQQWQRQQQVWRGMGGVGINLKGAGDCGDG